LLFVIKSSGEEVICLVIKRAKACQTEGERNL